MELIKLKHGSFNNSLKITVQCFYNEVETSQVQATPLPYSVPLLNQTIIYTCKEVTKQTRESAVQLQLRNRLSCRQAKVTTVVRVQVVIKPLPNTIKSRNCMLSRPDTSFYLVFLC